MIDWRQFLTSDPQVCHGQLCAKGTRVFVTNILDSLAEGASREEAWQDVLWALLNCSEFVFNH